MRKARALRWRSALVGAFLLALPASLSGQVTTVELSPRNASAVAGTTVRFSVVAKDANGAVVANVQPVFLAAPFDVAVAGEDGTIRLLRQGVARVMAVVGGVTGTAEVTVAPRPPATVRIEPVQATVVTGAVATLTATAYTDLDEPLSGTRVTFRSLDERVATVDASGMITALAPGTARIVVEAGGARGESTTRVIANPVARLEITGAQVARTGDVVRFGARAFDGQGRAVADAPVRWTVSGTGAAVYEDGAFVAEDPGTYVVSALVGQSVASASVAVSPRVHDRRLEAVFALPWRDLQLAEHWAIGNVLYVSTLAGRIYAFDVTEPGRPVLTDSLMIDARIINDISTTEDGRIGVLTREGASTRRNGIVFLDLADPLHPKVLSEYTETVTGGVHSAFVDGRLVYATDDATGSLRIIDFSDAMQPREIGRWQVEHPGAPAGAGSAEAGRYLHDVQVVDGLAYLAYWRDGLIVLDVGNGIRGGSPREPRFVSQLTYSYADLYPADRIAGTHTVFRYGDYAFVGDEVFPASFNLESRDRIDALGIVHVVDVSDIDRPRKVAEYRMPGGAHNLWVADDLLYIGAYEGGVRVVDVAGELRGDLTAQGREIDALWTGHPEGFRPNLPFAWGAQPHRGHIYTTDINSGLWITRLTPRIVP